jgi:hypothetical protein
VWNGELFAFSGYVVAMGDFLTILDLHLLPIMNEFGSQRFVLNVNYFNRLYL